MSMNVSKIERPKARFEEIVLLTGETFINVIPDTEAERIPGFIAIRGQSLKNSIQYIPFSAISSFTVKESALDDESFIKYLLPERK